MKVKFTIAALGEAVWDICDGRRTVGGAAANVAVHAAQYGCEAVLLSRVGSDSAGHELAEALRELNVDVSLMQADLFKPTGSAIIRYGDDGRPVITCPRSASFDELRFDSYWEAAAPLLDALYFNMQGQRAEPARTTVHRVLAAAAKAVKLFDVSLRRWDEKIETTVRNSLKAADLIKLNDDECRLLKKGLGSDADDLDFLRDLLRQFDLKLAALTLGENGCLLVTPEAEEFDPGYFIQPKDTLGAGDAFAAALLIKFLEGASLRETADFANRLAAFVALHHGTAPRWTTADLEMLAATCL